MLIIAPGSRLRSLSDLVAVGAELDGLFVGLFKAGFVPSLNMTFAQLEAVKADFTGYTVFTPVVWTGPFLDSSKTGYVLGGLIEFDCDAPVPPAEFVGNSIGGYYMYRGTELIGAEMFLDPSTGTPTPIPADAQDKMVPVIPRYSYGQ